jgi:thioredoxin
MGGIVMATFRCSVCEAFNRLADATPRRCTACESKLDVSGDPQEVDAAALARAIANSPVPLFVDFWAQWCGPCLLSAPVVKALGAKMAGEMVVLAVNTQDAPEAGEAHAIYAIPTFAVFQHGEEVARQMGLLPRGEMERWVRAVLAPPATEAHA